MHLEAGLPVGWGRPFLCAAMEKQAKIFLKTHAARWADFSSIMVKSQERRQLEVN